MLGRIKPVLNHIPNPRIGLFGRELVAGLSIVLVTSYSPHLDRHIYEPLRHLWYESLLEEQAAAW